MRVEFSDDPLLNNGVHNMMLVVCKVADLSVELLTGQIFLWICSGSDVVGQIHSRGLLLLEERHIESFELGKQKRGELETKVGGQVTTRLFIFPIISEKPCLSSCSPAQDSS